MRTLAFGQNARTDLAGAAQLAMAQLKENPADGYTLFVGDITALALNEGLFSKLSYNSKMDLAPITQLVDSPILLVVNEKGSYKSVQDVVDAAKTAPMPHIAYRGAVEGLQSVVSGEVDFMYDAIPSSGPLVKGERLRAIAVDIRVNCVHPSYIWTQLVQDRLIKEYGDKERALNAIKAMNPMGRLVEPEDVAAAVAFLASEDARMINGADLVVDGGRLIQ